MRIISILSLVAIFGLFSCSKERKVLHQVDGIWTVQEITFTSGDGASLTLNPTNATFSIQSCKTDENQTPNSCEATYEEGTGILVNFNYQVTADRENSILSIKSTGTNDTDTDAYVTYFKGVNDLTFEDDDNTLIMECNSALFQVSGKKYAARKVVLKR